MTRFARAKGSKSSNEKVPEPATPWSEMKKGMLEKNEKPNESTKKCVAMLKAEKDKKKQIVWSSLEADNDNSLNILKKHLEIQKEQKNSKQKNESNLLSEKLNKKTEKRKISGAENIVKKRKRIENSVADENLLKKMKPKEENKIKKKKVEEAVPAVAVCKKGKKNEKHFENKDLSNAVNVENTDALSKAVKKKRKKLNVFQSINSKEGDITVNVHESKKISLGGKGENLKNEEEKCIKKPEKVGNDLKKIVKKKEKAKNNVKKKMKNFAAGKSINKDPMTNPSEDSNVKVKGSRNYNNRVNKKEDKFRTSINIGGEIVNLVKFQGYFIKSEDAARLKDLKRQMSKEGIPAGQIESVIRLERRRCEKSLARMRKNVCFQCRKPGHILSQCPEASVSVDTGTGICYKCGSAEHTAFTCKVNQKGKYPFAECFICKEKGHIARECPDNPKGLYPKGGCCKLCGDVTHLKKDCPKRMAEIEENTLTLSLQDNRNVEGLEDEGSKIEAKGNNKEKTIIF